MTDAVSAATIIACSARSLDMLRTLKLYGPPGTGKTKTLMDLLSRELERTAADRIAFVTFTRAACQEVIERAQRPVEDLPFVKTVHATCLHQLGLSHEQLVGRKILQFGRSIGVEVTNGGATFSVDGLAPTGERQTTGDALLQLDHLCRHRGCTLLDGLRESALTVNLHYAQWFVNAYHAWKRQQHLYDFTDLLTAYLETGLPLPIDVLFIDEAQDLSYLQWQVVEKFGAEAQRRYIAGDDDQTIFTWAGASARLFNAVDGQVVVLPQSYRLPRRVFELAHDIITRVRARQHKEFRPRDDDGDVRPTGALSPDMLDAHTLVLYRNYHRGRALSERLEQCGVAFTGAGAVLDEESVQRALTAWVRLLDNDELSAAQLRALLRYCDKKRLLRSDFVYQPKSKANVHPSALIAPDVQLTDENWPHYLPKLPKLDYLQRAAAVGNGFASLLAPNVAVRSIHQSKGREAHTVIVDPELARKTYDSYMRDPDDEHRVWYVGVTRARERLFILTPDSALVYPL